VRGKIIETMPPGGLHGAIAIRLGILLGHWASQGDKGYVGAEAGYVLATLAFPEVLPGFTCTVAELFEGYVERSALD
jgi:Uma2 family endonuclease